MNTKKIIISIAVIALAIINALLFSGCWPGPYSPAEPAIPNDGGGVLKLSGTDPLTLDPAISGDMNSHLYISQIFSGLLRLDDDLKPVGDIAHEWQVNEAGTTYTFFLQEDVEFHDGEAVEASDFKYSWERACHPSTGSQTAATYLGDILGVSKVLDGSADEIEGISIVDDHTLEVTINSPKSYFLSKLTYPTSFVVDRDDVASGKEWWHNPNGTGPFRMENWQENERITLGRNETFYRQPAELSQIIFKLYSGVPMNLYEKDEIDVAGVSTPYIYRATDEKGPFSQDMEVYPELSFFYIGFNMEKPPFDDADIRRAFSHAIDKERLASLVFQDMVEPASGILPPGMPGYNKNLKGLEYDIDLARELIGDSQYGNASSLPPITITTSGQGGNISSDLEAIIYQWQQNLGVDVSVRQMERERFLYHLGGEADEMFFLGWIADYPHPQDFLDVLFHTGSDNNYGGYSNTEVDSLLDMANTEMDYETSLGMYQQAEQILVDDAACLPLWFGQNYMLVKPYVNGYRLNPLGMPSLSRISIESH